MIAARRALFALATIFATACLPGIAHADEAALLERIAALEARVAQLEARQAQQPAPVTPAAPRTAPAHVGKYVQRDAPDSGSYLRLRANRTLLIASPARKLEGTYRVDGDIITLTINDQGHTAVTEATIKNGTLTGNGETWVKVAEE